MNVVESFKAKVWTQESTGAWHFATLPGDLSKRIRTLTAGLRKPFGSFRVSARTGATTWSTSVFAETKSGAFVLPLKSEVRKREGIALGDMIEITVTFKL